MLASDWTDLLTCPQAWSTWLCTESAPNLTVSAGGIGDFGAYGEVLVVFRVFALTIDFGVTMLDNVLASLSLGVPFCVMLLFSFCFDSSLPAATSTWLFLSTNYDSRRGGRCSACVPPKNALLGPKMRFIIIWTLRYTAEKFSMKFLCERTKEALFTAACREKRF